MKPLFENNKIRHGFRIVIALLIASVVNYYLKLSHPAWLMVAVLFVMLTPFGSAVYQGLIRFFILAGIVVISAIILDENLLLIRLQTIAIGAVIGILTNILIFPDKVTEEFRHAMRPVLKSFTGYFNGIIELLIKHQPEEAELRKNEVEKNLQQLPRWVYNPGFDLALQKGYRFFFIKVSHIAEILFTLHYLARQPISESLIEKNNQIFLSYGQKINAFIQALETLLELKKLSEGVDDFSEELILLEKNCKQPIPLSLELLDVEKDLVYYYEFIYGLKDLRQALIQLAKTLR